MNTVTCVLQSWWSGGHQYAISGLIDDRLTTFWQVRKHSNWRHARKIGLSIRRGGLPNPTSLDTSPLDTVQQLWHASKAKLVVAGSVIDAFAGNPLKAVKAELTLERRESVQNHKIMLR